MLKKWYGTMTVQNVQEVADLILEVLDGKRYSFASFNEFVKRLDVRTGQRLNHDGAASG